MERTPPTVIRAQGAGVVAMVEQFPWGPAQTLTEVADIKTFIDTFAPPGMSHTGAGYLSVIAKSWPVLKIVNVKGDDAVKASIAIDDGSDDIITVEAKYPGTAGNSIVATVSDASDGDANHFDLEVTVTSSTGTTTDRFQNLNYSGTGADSEPSFTGTFLVGAIIKEDAGRPSNGDYTLAGGTDGTISSATYVGTQGDADEGVALCEADKTIDLVVTGDPGESFRAAVNAGLVAHADYMTDRMSFINGDSGQTLADVTADVADYRSIRCCYIDVWYYMRDDVDGTERLVPPAPLAASVAATLSPSTSFAWKGDAVKRLTKSVVRLETARGDGAATNTDNGVCTLIREDAGGFTFESAVNTNAPVSPAKRTYKRTRMGHYLAKAVVGSLRENTDSPNVPLNQQDEINAVQEFLETLMTNAKTDPNNLPHLLAGAIDDLSTFNSPSSLAAGEFTIPVSAQISPDQEKIFLSLNYGESVSVDISL